MRIDLDYSLEKNIKNLSDFNNKEISSITVCVMDRPRHKKIIDHLKDLKVKKPNYFLNSIGDTTATTIANIISKSDKLISEIKPGALIVKTAESTPLLIAVTVPSSQMSPVNIKHQPQRDKPI